MATTATWQSYLDPYSRQYNLPGGLLGALIRAESGGQPNVVSGAGAIGLGQLMPATAASLGVNPRDPIQNLRGAAMYLSQQLKRFGGNVNMALAAYNAGPGAVQKYNGIPPYQETREYIKRVNDFWKQSSKYGQAAGGVNPMQVADVGPKPVRKTVPGLGEGDIAKLQIAYMDEPTIGNAILQNRMNDQAKLDGDYQKAMENYNVRANRAQSAAITQNTVGGQVGNTPYIKTPNGWIARRRDGEAGWQYLDRLLVKGWGLQHDPGNGQTIGGNHDPDGDHPRGNASDFGDARNPVDLINRAYTWANQNRSNLGLGQLIWQAPGHYDHAHFATAW